QLGTVAGRVDHVQPQLAELELLAVAQAAERVAHPRRLVQAQLGAVLRGQPPRARDVVGVDVRVDHVAEREVALLQERVVLLDPERRVDDGGLVRLPRRDQVRRATAPLVEDLLEVHAAPSSSFLGRSKAQTGFNAVSSERLTRWQPASSKLAGSSQRSKAPFSAAHPWSTIERQTLSRLHPS